MNSLELLLLFGSGAATGVTLGIVYRSITFNSRAAAAIDDALTKQQKEFDEWNELENASLLAEADTKLAELHGSKQELAAAIVQERAAHDRERQAHSSTVKAYNTTIRELEQQKRIDLAIAKKEAIKQSKRVTHGQVTEHFVPFLPGFEWNPKDAKFLGAPLDYIVYDGLSEDQEVEVVFVEVKTNKSRTTKRQKRCIEAIEAGRVRYEEIRKDSN